MASIACFYNIHCLEFDKQFSMQLTSRPFLAASVLVKKDAISAHVSRLCRRPKFCFSSKSKNMFFVDDAKMT